MGCSSPELPHPVGVPRSSPPCSVRMGAAPPSQGSAHRRAGASDSPPCSVGSRVCNRQALTEPVSGGGAGRAPSTVTPVGLHCVPQPLRTQFPGPATRRHGPVSSLRPGSRLAAQSHHLTPRLPKPSAGPASAECKELNSSPSPGRSAESACLVPCHLAQEPSQSLRKR